MAAGSQLVGQTLGHYRIIEQIGAGGMGVVYRARDEQLERDVAVKVLPPGALIDEAARKRFRKEALALAKLNHPNVATVHEFGSQGGTDFLVTEYIPGLALDMKLASGAIAESEVVSLGIQFAQGLSAAHKQGIVHRDLKPANLRLTSDGRLKILDFGLAQLMPHASELGMTTTLAESQQVSGTLPYMAPEQLHGEPADARTDIWAAGAVLYEMATAHRPFEQKVPTVLAGDILHKSPPSPRILRPSLSPNLEDVILRCLEKDRAKRYKSACELSTDLNRLGTRASPLVARRWLWPMVAAVAVVATLIAGIFYFHRSPKLTDKDTIVLADFANSTGDLVFDDTLKTALSVSLNQSPFLNVLSDNKVAATLKLMARPTTTQLSSDVARELCQRAGSKAYIASSVASLGSEYVLGLKAVNCQSGDILAQEQVTAAAKEKVLDVLGQAATKLRGELGESLTTVQKLDVPLAQATTSSLDALKVYSLGLKAAREKGHAASLPYHQHAVELDPNFAMGLVAVGSCYWGLGETGRASEYYSRAFQLRAHASERERLSIAAYYYQNVTGELNKAAHTFQEQIETYPRDFSAYGDLGTVYAAEGQYEKAVEVTSQALHLAPDVVISYENLSNYLLALQRLAEARQTIHRALARKLDDYILRSALYGLAFLARDSGALAEETIWFAGKPEENTGLSLESDTEAYSGHLHKARELTKWSVDSAIRADNKENGAVWLEIAAQREAAFGNRTDARRAAVEGLKLAPTSPGVAAEAALALAMIADTAQAESLTQGLNKRFPFSDTQIQSLWLPTIQAQLALNRKNPGLALKALHSASAIELGQIVFVANLSCLYPPYVRGEAYLAAGLGKESAAEFQKVLDHSGIVWNCWTGALAHLGVARANALQAKTSQGADADAARVRALAAYKDFLTLWKDADPDIPILKEAKAEYAKLQ
jgi:eukaryotic-like serine/threonine-protein kinase